jgi:hypothetical protein
VKQGWGRKDYGVVSPVPGAGRGKLTCASASHLKELKIKTMERMDRDSHTILIEGLSLKQIFSFA